MRVIPDKVAEILGDERLELVYAGTEDAVKDSCATLRRNAQGLLDSVESRDPAVWKIYRNITFVVDHFKQGSGANRKEWIESMSALDTDIPLDPGIRDYINGKVLSDHDRLDRSVKGSVDVMLIPLLRLILRTGRFASTSCCSGRVVLFESNADHASSLTKRSTDFGRAGRFLYTSHCHVTGDEVTRAQESVDAMVNSKGDCYHRDAVEPIEPFDPGYHINQCDVILKFESFLIHVESNTLDDGMELLNLARQCGLKQSGIISGSRRVIVSIRGSYGLEAPIAVRSYGVLRERDSTLGSMEPGRLENQVDTTWLVTDEYFRYLIATCNRKFNSNIRQMLRFYWNCVQHFGIDIRTPFSIPYVSATLGSSTSDECSRLLRSKEFNNRERGANRSTSVSTLDTDRGTGMFVAVNKAMSIKQVKTHLEQMKIYDKSRKIVFVPPIQEVGHNRADCGSDMTDRNPGLLIPGDILNQNAVALLPIKNINDAILNEALVDFIYSDDLVITNGSFIHRLETD
ncbi:Methyltransferase TYW3 family protein [Babesia bovis T2Bo]|uniref:tRNA(Phe) 7-[(3-amino-3-carboxypropyl)-4-demethylwyosine(37)-N(4)]-methyltransferase n=1 Tax=Babesia bovis TaxID=5865 RepID=A7AUR3_BABBO|nr:Methyltransferase TYW3 family protein [Babesia bovis T2Bo]EDO06674.1 Methyltransferase TYW3 family protein [Babesia bovis T2Bo]|eukprot:XP_001610242.1 hypothetical protein [Babesia bovis T2Bo]